MKKLLKSYKKGKIINNHNIVSLNEGIKLKNLEKLSIGRSTPLRKNCQHSLNLSITQEKVLNFYLVNGNDIIKADIMEGPHNRASINAEIKPYTYYMIFNRSDEDLVISYSHDPSEDDLIYDPYKFENSEKNSITPDDIKEFYKVPDGYIDTLPKWYSFKFTYKKYNLIFIKPEMGISWQEHEKRNEFWEILGGNPIIINNDKVHYFVKDHEKFEIPMGTLHSVINPNKEIDGWIIIKESWKGFFDEKDIERIFNPNQYF